MKVFLASILAYCAISLQAQIDYNEYGIDTTYEVPDGLKVGQKAPHFKAHDVEGNTIKSSKLLKDHDIILVFYRGEWCPHCDFYLSNLNDSLNYLEEHNVAVVAIAPEMHENVKKTKESTNAQFILLSDHTEEIMKNYDVLFHVHQEYQDKLKNKKNKDIAEQNGKDVARLPVPATYVIRQDGTISYVHFDYDYTERPWVSELVTHFSEAN